MTVQSIVGGVDGVDKVTVIWIHDGVVKTVEFEKHVLRLEDKNMAD